MSDTVLPPITLDGMAIGYEPLVFADVKVTVEAAARTVGYGTLVLLTVASCKIPDAPIRSEPILPGGDTCSVVREVSAQDAAAMKEQLAKGKGVTVTPDMTEHYVVLDVSGGDKLYVLDSEGDDFEVSLAGMPQEENGSRRAHVYVGKPTPSIGTRDNSAVIPGVTLKAARLGSDGKLVPGQVEYVEHYVGGSDVGANGRAVAELGGNACIITRDEVASS